MRTTILVTMVAAMLLSVGCVMPSYKSLNAQRSAIRGTGDLGVSLSLDAVSTGDKAELIAKKTKDISIAVKAFLQTGKVSDLTIPEITGELRKLIPPDYVFLYDLLIAQIQGVTVPVEKIGANNVKRLIAICDGLITGCEQYNKADRPTADVNSKDLDLTPDIQVFGSKLKIEVAKRNVK